MNVLRWTLLVSLILRQSYGFHDISGKFVIDWKKVFPFSFLTVLSCSNDSADHLRAFSNQLSQHSITHQFIDMNIPNPDSINIHIEIIHKHYFVMDLDCTNAENFLVQANSSNLFIAPHKWIFFAQSNYENLSTEAKDYSNHPIRNEMELKFRHFAMFPDSEVYICMIFGMKYIDLLTVYRIGIYDDLIIENRGSWKENHGLNMTNLLPSSRRRQNLQKTNLKTCIVMIDPDTINHLEDFEFKKTDLVTKANFFWIQYLINWMNATMTYTWQNTWGYQDKNGTWNGMIGLLDRKQIDFGGTGTFLVPQRIGVIDYCPLYTPVWSRFIFKKPPLSYVKNLFTLPFHRIVWYAISLKMCLICGFLYLTMKWEWKDKESDEVVFQYAGQLNNAPNMSDNLLILFGGLLQQGSNYEPRNISAKMVVLMLLILSLSLYAAYTANIVALLQSTTSSIKTFHDLPKSGLKIGVLDIVYNRHYFQALEDPGRRDFYRNYVENKTSVWLSLEEGIDKVKKGFFAFHADAPASYMLMQETYKEEEKCNLDEVDYLNVVFPMLVLPQHSRYRELFRVGSLWIKEVGLQQRTTKRLFTGKPNCAGQSSFVSVGAIDCYAAFLIIFYGNMIALGFFLIEVIHYQCSKYINRNQVKNLEISICHRQRDEIDKIDKTDEVCNNEND